MCGIAGVIRFDDTPIDPSRARAAMASLGHRGPDGRHILEMPRCTLVHTRLSVLDAPGGGQPMTLGGDGTAPESAVVFNGEIYNHRSLRQTLGGLGRRFTTDHSDTEALLHAHAAWGDAAPSRLEGMFAYALWQPSQRRLTAARDRFGEKPFYFHRSADGREFLFASTIAALLVMMPAERRGAVNHAALVEYLSLGYTTRRTLVEGVEELPPAHRLVVNGDGAVRVERYWSPPRRAPGETADAERTLSDTIERSVAARLESDVPLGCFLSGGMDSSLVAAFAQRSLHALGGGPLRTFSMRMPDADYDEGPFARRVATHLGTRHTELLADPHRDVLADLEQLVALSGAPTGDSSILPTYWLSLATRGHVTVALSGDGGDELFGGYDRYTAIRWLARHRRWLARLPLARWARAEGRSHMARLGRLADAAQSPTPAEQYRRIVGLFDDDDLRTLGLDAEPSSPSLPDWPADADSGGPVSDAMRWDLEHYLPGDVLNKVDRASMAVALEVRAPLLDTDVAEAALSLPLESLMPGGRRKGLLRRIAAPLLPPEIVNRRKHGFALPIGRWMRASMRDGVAARLLDGSLSTLGLRPTAVETLWRGHVSGEADHSHRLFALLTLSLWAAGR